MIQMHTPGWKTTALMAKKHLFLLTFLFGKFVNNMSSIKFIFPIEGLSLSSGIFLSLGFINCNSVIWAHLMTRKLEEGDRFGDS